MLLVVHHLNGVLINWSTVGKQWRCNLGLVKPDGILYHHYPEYQKPNDVRAFKQLEDKGGRHRRGKQLPHYGWSLQMVLRRCEQNYYCNDHLLLLHVWRLAVTTLLTRHRATPEMSYRPVLKMIMHSRPIRARVRGVMKRRLHSYGTLFLASKRCINFIRASFLCHSSLWTRKL